MSTNPTPTPLTPLTFDQFLAALEEWSSREQLGQCVSTLRRFHATGYTIAHTVKWLQLRESVLKEDEPQCHEGYEDRGEGFGA